jgi:hypothetical protein
MCLASPQQKKKATSTPVAPAFASVNEQALRQQHAREQKSMTKEEREKKRYAESLQDGALYLLAT